MDHYELYEKYNELYNFRKADCCANCKYGDVYHEEEMYCNRLDHIEVLHTNICELFKIKTNENRPPNLHEVNGCHNCKYAENVHWGEDMSCGKYDYDSNAPYDICDSWEEDK